MNSKELIRRALMGDSESQKLCTEKGIVLPCPCCGGRAKKALLLGRFGIACTECPVCIIPSPYGDSYKENLKYWNTRPAPPVGKCKDCINATNPGSNIVFCDYFERDMMPDDFCSCFEPREE